MIDNVSGRSGNISHYCSKLSDKAIEECWFSDIGRSNKSDVHNGEKVQIKDERQKISVFFFCFSIKIC
jgi:hypothetical protein